MNKYSKILFLVIVILLHFKTYGQIIDTACVGETNVRYKVDLHVGASYFWQVNGGTIVNGQGTNDIGIDWGLTPGTFVIYMTETNAANCIGDAVISKVIVQTKPVVTFLGPDSVCEDEKFSLQAKGATNYSWEGGSTGNALFVKATQTKTWFVVGTNLVCSSDTTYKTVVVIPKPSAIFAANPNTDWMKNDEVFFASNDTSIRKWVWEINGQNLNITKSNFSRYFNDTGQFRILLTATNANNCTDTFSITRSVFNRLDIYVPTAFTPNNDYLNDVFEPVGINFSSYFMQIFDHFGGLVFEGTNKGWDGKINGNEYATDNFTYKIVITLLNGKKKYVDGNVVLVR
ncbi:MAG: T9SS type B sorting domain-containing protein [Bacteroidia bacterium]